MSLFPSHVHYYYLLLFNVGFKRAELAC